MLPAAEDWFAGKNASPILLSMKTGSQTRTYKPVCMVFYNLHFRRSNYILRLDLFFFLQKTLSPPHVVYNSPAQVVYKPSEQAIVDSERSNDRKFSFLSSETKPDYRPLAERGLEMIYYNYSPCSSFFGTFLYNACTARSKLDSA